MGSSHRGNYQRKKEKNHQYFDIIRNIAIHKNMNCFFLFPNVKYFIGMISEIQKIVKVISTMLILINLSKKKPEK